MEDIYRSQFRMPYGLYEKLKAEADKAGRSVNSELVVRLEQSLSAGSDDADIVMVFDILGRLSRRNPHLHYKLSFSTGEELEEGEASAERPATTLAANPPPTASEAIVNQRVRLSRKPPAKG